MTAQELIEKYGVWGFHEEYCISDWQNKIANDDTRLGYWEWVEHMLEEDAYHREQDEFLLHDGEPSPGPEIVIEPSPGPEQE